jgi:glycosyltransferase involved in cell wall biosynthesis
VDRPVLSIIVPVYRTPLALLNRLLESAAGQTERNIEIIAVDDASPDECPAVLSAFAARDRRMTVIHRPTNGRAGAARNNGLERARGKFVLFADADDFIQPNMGATLVAIAEQHQADIVGCSYTLTDMEGRLAGRRRRHNLRFDLSLSCQRAGAYRQMTNALWDKFFRRETIASLRFEQYEANIGEDTVFNVAALCCSRIAVTTEYEGYDYTVHCESATGRVGKGMAYLRTLSQSAEKIQQILREKDQTVVGQNFADLITTKRFSTGCGWIAQHPDSEERRKLWKYWQDHFYVEFLPQIKRRRMLAILCRLALVSRQAAVVHHLTWIACRLASIIS